MGQLLRDEEEIERASWPLRAAEAAAGGVALSAVAGLTGLAGEASGPVLPLWILAGTPALLLTSALVAARLWAEREG
jgi:hypothetical protein